MSSLERQKILKRVKEEGIPISQAAKDHGIGEQKCFGHEQLAIHLGINKKRTLRMMKLLGIKPYRRRGRKWKKPSLAEVPCPSLLMENFPSVLN